MHRLLHRENGDHAAGVVFFAGFNVERSILYCIEFNGLYINTDVKYKINARIGLSSAIGKIKDGKKTRVVTGPK